MTATSVPTRAHTTPDAAPRLAGLAATVVAAAAAGLVLAAVAVAGLATGVPLSNITRDAAAVADLPWYIGALSSVGIAAWAAGAGAALLGGLLARRTGDRATVSLLLPGAALSLMLMLDDMLELHEGALHALGLPEMLAYVVYAALAVAWLARNVGAVLESEWVLLVGALLLFAGSMVVDQAFRTGNLLTYAEDSLKLVGVVLWSTWLVRTALRALAPRLSAGQQS